MAVRTRWTIILIVLAVVLAGVVIANLPGGKPASPREFLVSVETGFDARKFDTVLEGAVTKVAEMTALSAPILLVTVVSDKPDTAVIAALKGLQGVDDAERNMEVRLQK